MKRALVFMLTCVSVPTWSADSFSSIAKPIGKHMHTLGNAFACELLAGTRGFANAPQCRDRNASALSDYREFDKSADKKTLRECMKPDNLIDDDVRKCMKGL